MSNDISSDARLRIASHVAPIVRNRVQGQRGRRLIVVDHNDPTNILRETDEFELIVAQLKRAGIEIDTKVNPGVRPQALWCPCGRPFLVPKKGRIARACAVCLSQTHCPGFDGPYTTGPNGGEAAIGARVLCPSSIIARKGRPWRCQPCAARARGVALAASMTPEQRAERGRIMRSAMSQQQRSEKARAYWATQDREQRSERARKGQTAEARENRSKSARRRVSELSPEQRKEMIREAHKANESMSRQARIERACRMNSVQTSAQRSERQRKVAAAEGHERRVERAHKAWATRRANATKKR